MPIFSFLGVAIGALLLSAGFRTHEAEPVTVRYVQVPGPTVMVAQPYFVHTPVAVPVAMPVYVPSAFSAPTSCSIDAGPLWNNRHAQTSCPSVCATRGGAFTGQWRTTRWGSASVCQCNFAGGTICPPSTDF